MRLEMNNFVAYLKPGQGPEPLREQAEKRLRREERKQKEWDRRKRAEQH